MSYIIQFLPLATLLALITRKMAESMIAATAVTLVLLLDHHALCGGYDGHLRRVLSGDGDCDVDSPFPGFS